MQQLCMCEDSRLEHNCCSHFSQVTLSLAERGDRSASKVRFLGAAAGANPELKKKELQREEDERERAALRREAQQRRVRERNLERRRVQTGGGGARSLTAAFLEGDASDEEAEEKERDAVPLKSHVGRTGVLRAQASRSGCAARASRAPPTRPARRTPSGARSVSLRASSTTMRTFNDSTRYIFAFVFSLIFRFHYFLYTLTVCTVILYSTCTSSKRPSL